MEESLNDVVNKKFLMPMEELKITILNNEEKIKNFGLSILEDNNKERVLLNFRRLLEMIIKTPLFVTVKSKSTNNIIAVRNDNLLQLVDNRYYSELQLSTFLDIFKIETNNFQSLNCNGEPHIKLIINYILSHYNTTFRKFMNRNAEYYYMYKFFFENGEIIKKILDFLNSYHYNIENEELYLTDLDEFFIDIKQIFEEIYNLFEKIEKKFSS